MIKGIIKIMYFKLNNNKNCVRIFKLQNHTKKKYIIQNKIYEQNYYPTFEMCFNMVDFN